MGEGGRPDAAPQRWRLQLAYDGGAFRGFADQPGDVPTVARALRKALGRTARMPEPPLLTSAGRTDAGVHARGQVVHVDLPTIPFDGEGLARALNRQVSPAIVVVAATPVPDSFHARRSATARAYRYLVWNAPAPDPMLAPLAWHVRDPLDLRAMNTASDVLLGTHDFRSFCRRPPGTSADKAIVRRVTGATWSVDRGPEALDAGVSQRWGAGPDAGRDTGGSDASRDLEPEEARLLRFDITASSFCHQMVRSLVGSLVEVGRGKGNAATLMERLRAASRHRAPDPAPAFGLCLLSVTYGAEPEPD